MNIFYKLPKEHLKLNYLLTYLLIALSGIDFFGGDLYLLMSFIFVAFIFIFKKIKIDDFTYLFVGSFILLFIFQSISTNIIPYKTQIGFIVRILFGYFTIKIIGKEFPKFFVNVLLVFSLISFIFYIPIIIAPKFEQLLVDKVSPYFEHYNYTTVNDLNPPFPQFIIYTINTDRERSIFPRNSGPFWEPGAFAGYLIIAIIFNIIISQKLLRSKQSFILAIALFSTLSTSGYLAFSVLTAYYFLISKKRIIKLVFFPVVIVGIYFSFSNLDFLGKKIEKDIKYSFSASPESLEKTRFVGGILDIREIMKNPILGIGLAAPDYSFAVMKYLNHRTNGDTDFAKKFGLIMFFVYFYSIYKSYRTLCLVNNFRNSFSIFIMIAIFIIGFSELYFNQPLFISFIFMNFLYFRSFQHPKVLNRIKYAILKIQFQINHEVSINQ